MSLILAAVARLRVFERKSPEGHVNNQNNLNRNVGVFCFKTNSKTDPLGFKKTLALFLCFTIRAKNPTP
jgi:hypothetical protein